jgi:hypothetical protein
LLPDRLAAQIRTVNKNLTFTMTSVLLQATQALARARGRHRLKIVVKNHG